MNRSNFRCWASTLALASCVACGGTASPQSTVPTHDHASDVATSPLDPTDGPPEPPPLLSDEPVALAGGLLTARLPRGEQRTWIGDDRDELRPGFVEHVFHVVGRDAGALRIHSADAGFRATTSFASRITAYERVVNCYESTAVPATETGLLAPAGFELVAFLPDASCLDGVPPPAVRLYVSTPAETVVEIELECQDEGCLPDRHELLQAFIDSFAVGPASPPTEGPRFLGPSSELGLRCVVPGGYLVTEGEGEDTRSFEVFRPAPLGQPRDSLLITYLFSQSPNSLREDYVERGDRARTLAGRIAGRRTRLIERTRGASRTILGRLELPAFTIDVQIEASTDEARDRLLAVVAGAELSDPDSDEALE